MKKAKLVNYARLIARRGLNIQKGQDVIIRASLDQPEFVRILVSECYKVGARTVTVDWSDVEISKLSMKNQSIDVQCSMDEWKIKRLEHRANTLPATVLLKSDDPDGMKGVNPAKMAKVQKALYPVMKPYQEQMENRYQWCIAGVPGAKWAKKVFPGMSTKKAIEHMWEVILSTSRADGEDPCADWDAHNADLSARCKYLNALGIESLRYQSKNGTNFTVGLMPQSVFCGGNDTTLGSNIDFNPNIPSEEVFTSPMRGKAEGVLVSTMPLSYRGQLIENFSIRFENGRAVSVMAEKGEDALKEMITMDEGAAYLGEVALVPYDSPIRNSETIFYNTLFDENACCHFALGRGYRDCIRDYGKYSLEECREMGLNESMIHVDFMVGSEDLDIIATTRDGKQVAIFKNGNWAF